MKNMAYLGPSYTFSDMCFNTFFKNQFNPIHKKTIEDIFDALSDDTDILIPIENSTDGFVQKTIDGLIHHEGYIISTMSVPVQFGCLGNPKTAKTLYVQFKSLGQCQKFIQAHPHLNTVLTASNQASYDLKQSDDDVAIVPLHMIYDLDHVKHVEDYEHNQTRFIHVSKTYQASTALASMIITPKIDRPGLLSDILDVFKKHDINLTSIMSRPTKTVIGTYHFYIEMSMNPTHQFNIHDVINHMRQTFDIRFLGTYKKVTTS